MLGITGAHIAVDADGRLLIINLTPADISDSASTQAILEAIHKRWPWVKHPTAEGFQVLPRRWVVERTSGWVVRMAPPRA